MSATTSNMILPERISPLTLALFEDTGWYRANYSMSSIMGFGHGAGCNFLNKACIQPPGVVPKYSEGYFCNMGATNVYKCDSMHRVIANCDLMDYSKIGDGKRSPPPTTMSYFENKNFGARPAHNRADYCPTFTNVIFTCRREPVVGKLQKLSVESFTETSRCYNSNFQRPLCMETICNERKHMVQAKFSDGSLISCQNDGQKIAVPNTSYTFECPRLADICPDLICPFNCAGAGKCLWHLDRPKCQCFDTNDTTSFCNNYTITPTSAFPNKTLYIASLEEPEEKAPLFNLTNFTNFTEVDIQKNGTIAEIISETIGGIWESFTSSGFRIKLGWYFPAIGLIIFIYPMYV